MEEQEIEKTIKAMSLEELREYAIKAVKDRSLWQRNWNYLHDENNRMASKLAIIRETINL